MMPISFKAAVLYWLKLGFISFGGPAGQIAIMHQDLVEKKQWITEPKFLHALNFCMLLPGPEAQQLATYMGWRMHKTWGGIIAGLLFILPSFFILIALAWVTLVHGDLPIVAGALAGIKPAVVAIIFMALYRIGSRTLTNPLLWLIACCAFIGIYFFKLPFPLIILLAGLTSFFASKLNPDFLISASQQADAQAISIMPSTVSSGTFTWRAVIKIIAAGLGAWAIVMAYLTFTFGWQGAYTQMSWFFTKAALLTFGGAYAVLPYVHQGAVEHYHWLTTSQMMTGLALGETTPGPLVMVVTYVGFVAGWSADELQNAPFLSALLAASIVTFFTFLPSFLFVLIGAPLIEITHNQLQFTAPLTAITAAVVGVILNLAVFFSLYLLVGEASQFNWQALTSIGLAGLLLMQFRWNVVLVILLFGIIGIVSALI